MIIKGMIMAIEVVLCEKGSKESKEYRKGGVVGNCLKHYVSQVSHSLEIIYCYLQTF